MSDVGSWLYFGGARLQPRGKKKHRIVVLRASEGPAFFPGIARVQQGFQFSRRTIEEQGPYFHN
ncbi:MAG TPA: hypothetical protein VE734_10990 [Terriglobales bacterium]|nr:hypothetical protein [Terriglobales bacterium]